MKNWEVIEIGELGKVVTGKTPLTIKPEYWNGDIPFITPGDITDYKYISETERKVTGEGVKNTTTLLPPNTLIIVCIGSTIGKVALTNKECITNQQINSVIIDLTRFDPNYLYYAFSMVSKQFKYNSGTAAVPIIKKSLFEKYLLTVPPLDEQRRISKVLSLVDEAIQKADEAISHTELFKLGLMQKLFVNEKWPLNKLSEVAGCKLIMGQSPDSKSYNQEHVGVPFLQGNAEFGFMFPTPIYFTSEPTKIVEQNDLLISVRAPVGDLNISPFQLCIGRGLAGMRFTKSNYQFYYYWFQSRKSYIESLGMGSTFKAITTEQLKKLIVPVPDLTEQNDIAKLFSDIDLKISLMNNRKQIYMQLKKGLMHDLLTGKKRVVLN